ncbi:MAG: molecular chaperone DnaJ [Chloroflexi bacterium]|nr:molecular chaperone DnaJ [Chloroflexota bacterium]
MARDYYEVLGVSRSASKDEIRQAFRRLARQYHPDINKERDAEARFKEINEAHEVLSDDERRARYDRFGHAGVTGVGGMGGAGVQGFGFEEIFEEFMNNFAGQRSTRRRGPRPGGERHVDVAISFEEAVFGVDKDIEFDRLEVCDRCQGSGSEPGTSVSTCPDCRGTGEYRNVQQTFLGSMVRVSTCPRCNGRGEIVTTPCKTCTGNGRMRKRHKMTVKIPGGVRDGMRIMHNGMGDAGERGVAPSGSLYVSIHVKDHEFYKRRDDDIILDININVAQAALGDKIVIPTVDGEVELTVPPGTQTGKVFRLRGKGFPRLTDRGLSSGRGDQLVYVQVAVPTSLNEEQRRLFEQLAKTFGSGVQPQGNGRGFFDRVMDFFSGEQN